MTKYEIVVSLQRVKDLTETTTINSNNKKQKEMKTQRIEVIGKIKDVTFRNRSVYGNPSYNVVFEDETGETIKGYTAPNAACAYGIKNPDLREFAYIEYHVTKSGKVVIDYIFNKYGYEKLIGTSK